MAEIKSRIKTLTRFLVEEGKDKVVVYAMNEYDARIQALDIFNARALGLYRTHMNERHTLTLKKREVS